MTDNIPAQATTSFVFPDDLSQFPTVFNQLNDAVIQKILAYMREVFHELPHNTQRAIRNDFATYYDYCSQRHLTCLSSDIETSKSVLIEFVYHLTQTTYKKRVGTKKHEDGSKEIMYEDRKYKHATIKRFVASISEIYRIAELPNPVGTNYCKKRIKNILRNEDVLANPKAATALRYRELDLINASAPRQSVKERRDLAMLNLAFDGLLRTDEVIRVQLEDIDFTEGALIIRKSKTDQEGRGQKRYVSPQTISYIQDYLDGVNQDPSGNDRAKNDPKALYDGVLFRSVTTNGETLRPLHEDKPHVGLLDHSAVVKAYRRLAKSAKIELNFSGHSPRVGGAVSLAEIRADGLEIQRAGGWSTQAMPARYTEQTRLQDSAMARLRQKN